MRVLFLDFDGVLNSYPWRIALEGAGRGAEVFSSLSAEHVARLNRLLAATDAVVVVSSTWRLHFDLDGLRGVLGRAGFVGEVVDVTPQLPAPRMWQPAPRGREIQHWLDAHPGVDSFAIVDDDADMAHLEHRLVRTSDMEGLTDADADRLIALLGSV